MNPLAVGVAILGALVAAAAAVADGALMAIEGTTTASQPAYAEFATSRDAAHRALTLARRLMQMTTGAAIGLALSLDDRPLWEAIGVASAAAAVTVALTESYARAAGDALAERALVPLTPFIEVLEALLSPITTLSRKLDAALLRVLPPEPDDEEDREATVEQFSQVVAAEAEVSGAEETLMRRVFSLGETEVREVMIPRVDILGVEMGTPWSELLDRVRASEHARLPVYRDTLDEITGILYAKDLLPFAIEDEEPAAGWESLARPPLFIPATKRVDAQLREFRASRTHIAIVVDEYGGTAGLVTIEDVLEELVGEIRDEYDTDEPDIVQEAGGRYWVDGRVTLAQLSELTGRDFLREGVTTVGGLVFAQLARVPRAGDALEAEGHRLVVERVRRRSVARVYLEPLPVVADDDGDAL